MTNDSDSDESAVTLTDKVEKYFDTHKRPVTVKMLAERFMVNSSTIRRTLPSITRLVVTQIGSTNWYRRKA